MKLYVCVDDSAEVVAQRGASPFQVLKLNKLNHVQQPLHHDPNLESCKSNRKPSQCSSILPVTQNSALKSGTERAYERWGIEATNQPWHVRTQEIDISALLTANREPITSSLSPTDCMSEEEKPPNDFHYPPFRQEQPHLQ